MRAKTRKAQLTDLQRALDAQSYEWLAENMPDVFKALETEVNNGASPEEAKLFVLNNYARPELALRIEQAARHMSRKD